MTAEKDDNEDAETFRRAVGEVRPVASRHLLAKRRHPPPVPKQTLADTRRVLSESIGPLPPDTELQPGEILEFHRSGVTRSTLTRLRRGQFRIDAETDLHGMTAEVAFQELTAFLRESVDRNRRCVRIIHGKGLRSGNSGPVLKGLAARWLALRDEVLAFVSARPEHGGTGALYVLLRATKR